jgi:glycosyltransferase involved in cell wall biosynthesis
MKLITVITVVFNESSLLEETITSVLKHRSPLIEYVVIDGNSTDGTLDIIRKHEHNIDKWISEPDRGIYDAMNKGIGLATGKFVYFINCGDRLLELPINILQQECNADLVCFPIMVTGDKVRKPLINWRIKFANTLPHQGLFYRVSKELVYDSQYKVFGDYALNLDFVLSKRVIRTYDEPVLAFHSLNGVSNRKGVSSELFSIIRSKLGLLRMVFSYLYFKTRGLYHRF